MIDPVSIGLMGVDLVSSGINYFRGKQDLRRLEGDLAAMGDSPNYTLSGDYDRMVNMALNAPQTGLSMAERAYGDQAAAAGAYGSRGLGSLNAASRNLAATTADLEAQRLNKIQGAIGTRAGAEQQVMNANVGQDIRDYNVERNRLLEEKAAAQEAVNAGITGALNLGGGAVSGLAGGLMNIGGDGGFLGGLGTGLEGYLNPTQIPIPASAKGTKTAKNAFVSDGPENHDKNEYLIARMVKTASGGMKLEPVATSTGGELHQETNDGEISVLNSNQVSSVQDGYEDYKRTGKVARLIEAARNIFELPQFKK
jgi:hypothetical protein